MNISAKELRFGNYVFIHDEPTKIVNLCQDGVNATMDDGQILKWIDDAEVSGICLHSELVEAIGFKRVGDEWKVEVAGNTEIFEWGHNGNLYYTGGEGVRFGVGCKYLHQLQNLILAMTGKEFKFNVIALREVLNPHANSGPL